MRRNKINGNMMKNGENKTKITPLKYFVKIRLRGTGGGSIFQIYNQIRALYQIGKRCKSEGRDIVARVKRETMRKGLKRI